MKRRDLLKGAVVSTGALASGLIARTGLAAEVNGNTFGNIRHGENFHKIDAFSHFQPISYIQYMATLTGGTVTPGLAAALPEMSDINGLDPRLQMMDDEGIDTAVIFPQPTVESLGAQFTAPGKATLAAQFINNYMANLCTTYPDKFKFAALLPLVDQAEMEAEFDRVMTLPGAIGLGINTGPTHAAPDDALHLAVYEKAVQYNVPVWIHLDRSAAVADFNGEHLSIDYIWLDYGYLFDGTAAMMRIVHSGIFDRHPNLKIVCHQRGHLIPLYCDRMRMHIEVFDGIMLPPSGMPPGFDVDHYINQFKNFYVDAICSGDDSDLLMRSINFFGANKVMYATDTAYSPRGGRYTAEKTRNSVLGLQVNDNDMQGIFANNIINLIPSQMWNK